MLWAIASFIYICTMTSFAFVLGLCDHRIRKKTFIKNTLWVVIGIYIVSFIFLRIIYNWHFLFETVLLTIILLGWIAGQRCQLIGLTGGIACGKSTVSEILIEEKLSVIDLDKISHQVTRSMTKQIANAFPEDDIIGDNGYLDSKKLGKVVFADKKKLKRLNKLTHTRIALQTLKEILYRKLVLWESYVVLDIPLLFETRLFAYICCPIILVYIDDRELQIKRLIKRSKGVLTREEAIQRIEAQMSLEYKKKNSDVLLDNEGTTEDLRKQILSKVFPALLKSFG